MKYLQEQLEVQLLSAKALKTTKTWMTDTLRGHFTMLVANNILFRDTVILTLRLHPSADQCQWVTCQLATRAGNGTAANEHHHPWIS